VQLFEIVSEHGMAYYIIHYITLAGADPKSSFNITRQGADKFFLANMTKKPLIAS